MATVAFTILPVLPLLVWFLQIGWSPNSTEGEVLLRVPVSLVSRLKMLWGPFALGLAILVFGLILSRIPWTASIAYIIICVLVLSVPVSYTLTTVGIRTGKGVFRRWTEFAGVRRSPSGAVLQGAQRASSYSIYLSGNREDDDFVLTLKHLLQDSYKGRATVRDRLRGTD